MAKKHSQRVRPLKLAGSSSTLPCGDGRVIYVVTMFAHGVQWVWAFSSFDEAIRKAGNVPYEFCMEHAADLKTSIDTVHVDCHDSPCERALDWDRN